MLASVPFMTTVINHSVEYFSPSGPSPTSK